jgi:hypothetical protein
VRRRHRGVGRMVAAASRHGRNGNVAEAPPVAARPGWRERSAAHDEPR